MPKTSTVSGCACVLYGVYYAKNDVIRDYTYVKTLNNGYKRLLMYHRIVLKLNQVASGIIKGIGELEVLLDDIFEFFDGF